MFDSQPFGLVPVIAFAVVTCGASPWLSGERGAAAQQPSAGIEFFESRIRPVLVEKCYPCHAPQAKSIKGGLLLDTREAMRNGGESGPAIVPGRPQDSRLISAIRYEELEMPPKEKLPAAVIEDFSKWIEMGAPDPRDGNSTSESPEIDIESGRSHWSFQPISNPMPPDVKNTSWPRTDIDRFVLAQLENRGLHPVADATPSRLRRRVAFDLTGLPPGESTELDLNNSNLDALVAELLASPRFGERWGRHWLDVARYAESTGGGHNVLLPLAFRYRNWVVDAFNSDLPYNAFIKQQIAGDLMPASSAEDRNAQTIATGFLCVGTRDLREKSENRYRMGIAEEQIDVVGRALLGLTIACAKCHDHKFDPIPTRDYYALAGIFVSSEPMLGARRNRERNPFAAGLLPLAGSGANFTDADQAALLQQRVDITYARLKVRDARWAVLGEMKIPIKQAKPEQEKIVDNHPSVQAAVSRLADLENKYETLRKRYAVLMPQSMTGMRDIAPLDVPIHIRGEDSQLGEIVPRGFLQVLTTALTKPVDRQHSGRLELAEWIADRRNPLAARVMVNRIWMHLFGTGIVETPDDFGKTGEPPSNIALLDHLSQRFVDLGWSVKKLIAEIMHSHVYRLGTYHDTAAFEIDPANRLYWRMNRRRLDSDSIRDTILYNSGDLVLGRPEPQFPLFDQSEENKLDDRVKSIDRTVWLQPTQKYRTIYQPLLRDYVPDEWSVFDFPDTALVTGKRGLTTVPTQALYLLNNPFVIEQSKKSAQRILVARPTIECKTIVHDAFVLILNRTPSLEESRECVDFLNRLRESKGGSAGASAACVDELAVLCQTLIASAEFRYLH